MNIASIVKKAKQTINNISRTNILNQLQNIEKGLVDLNNKDDIILEIENIKIKINNDKIYLENFSSFDLRTILSSDKINNENLEKYSEMAQKIIPKLNSYILEEKQKHEKQKKITKQIIDNLRIIVSKHINNNTTNKEEAISNLIKELNTILGKESSYTMSERIIPQSTVLGRNEFEEKQISYREVITQIDLFVGDSTKENNKLTISLEQLVYNDEPYYKDEFYRRFNSTLNDDTCKISYNKLFETLTMEDVKSLTKFVENLETKEKQREREQFNSKI